MKLKTFITILLSSLLLVACGGNEKDPEKEVVNAPVVDGEEATAPEDKLIDVALNNGEITATIEMHGREDFPVISSAGTMYSALGDELLLHEGWKVLTVDFVGIGTVRMDRSEQKDDGVGPYFPIAEIARQLGVE